MNAMIIPLDELLELGRARKCSDLHLTVGLPPVFRYNGELEPHGNIVLSKTDIDGVVRSIVSDEQMALLNAGTDVDFCYVCCHGKRYRANVYRQRGNAGVALRILNEKIPSLTELGMPAIFQSMAMLPRGLVLITGPTGSGKSTTLAAMIDYINMYRHCHILTVEDPIEYMHENKGSMINQREVGEDVGGFALALRSALREDPDVILVGEMRDQETIGAAITAAETGHFVLSTLHTIGAANTIDRIIDVFPPHQQQQIRIQLASVLKGVVTQQLLPKADGSGRIAALEIMTANDAIANLIRENKCHQINTVIQTNVKNGMQTLDMHLALLANQHIITMDAALDRATSAEGIRRYLA